MLARGEIRPASGASMDRRVSKCPSLVGIRWADHVDCDGRYERLSVLVLVFVFGGGGGTFGFVRGRLS